MEAEIWGVSEWAGKLPEGSQISEHWAVQTEELLWGVSGSLETMKRENKNLQGALCF